MNNSEVTIEELGPRGEGFYNDQNGRVYVERSVPGDVLEIKVRQGTSGPAGPKGSDGKSQGDIIKIIQPSADRVDAPCENYDVCGSCTLQHVSEEFYRAWKQKLVVEALDRQNVTPKQYLEPVFITGGSRRRVTFSALLQKNNLVLGYNKRRSKFISDIDQCLVADPAIMTLRAIIKQHLKSVMQKGKVVDVFIQKINGSFDVVLTGPVGQKSSPDLSVMEMAAALIHQTKIARLSWRMKFHDDIEIIVEKEAVRKRFGKLDVNLPPATFLQPTVKGESALVDAVMKLLPEKGHFADLFCGCGTFAGAMLANGSVDGYENDPNAIEALKNAVKRKHAPLKAYERDLFRKPLTLDELNRYDAIILDPPRAGATKQVAILAQSKVKRLINVSCNPVSFARDARVLTDGGYVFESVQVIDQFTWSHHVELVGAYSKS